MPKHDPLIPADGHTAIVHADLLARQEKTPHCGYYASRAAARLAAAELASIVAEPREGIT